MTDRERFEERAIACNATILISELTTLKTLASNGQMITIYHFDENGKFVGIEH